MREAEGGRQKCLGQRFPLIGRQVSSLKWRQLCIFETAPFDFLFTGTLQPTFSNDFIIHF